MRGRWVVAALVVICAVAGIGSGGLARAQIQGLPPGPLTIFDSRFGMGEQAGRFEVIHIYGEFPPGSSVAPHVHGGPGYVTMLEGEIVLREGDVETHYGLGESWVEHPGQIYSARNDTARPARFFVTYLVADGTAVTTVLPE